MTSADLVSAFGPLQTLGADGTLTLSMKASLLLAVAALGACADKPAANLCDVAQAPEKFVGREVTMREIILVGGHGSRQSVPNSDCPVFAWFGVEGPR